MRKHYSTRGDGNQHAILAKACRGKWIAVARERDTACSPWAVSPGPRHHVREGASVTARRVRRRTSRRCEAARSPHPPRRSYWWRSAPRGLVRGDSLHQGRVRPRDMFQPGGERTTHGLPPTGEGLVRQGGLPPSAPSWARRTFHHGTVDARAASPGDWRARSRRGCGRPRRTHWTVVESTQTTVQSTCPTASECCWTWARSRSLVPSAKRSFTVFHGP